MWYKTKLPFLLAYWPDPIPVSGKLGPVLFVRLGDMTQPDEDLEQADDHAENVHDEAENDECY